MPTVNAAKKAVNKKVIIEKVIEKVVNAPVTYETILILRASLTDEDVVKAIEKIQGSVVQKSGEIIKIENMGRKRLAYDVKKEKRGVFILVHFKGNQTTVFEVQRLFEFDEMIIKYITVKVKLQDLKSNPEGEDSTVSVPQENSQEVNEDV